MNQKTMNQKTMNRPTIRRSFTISENPAQAEGQARLHLDGSLDADAAPRLSEELERRLVNGQTYLELDFSGVRFISSSGVGSLIASVGEFRDEGGDILVHGLSSDLRHVFEVLDLMDYLNLD